MSDLFAICEDPLPELAAQINAAHVECEHALKAGLARALKVGQLLVAAKQRVGHGQWLPWLKTNVHFSERSAQDYMRVARRWSELEAIPQGVADLPFHAAVTLLTAPAAEKPATGTVPLPLAHYRDAGLSSGTWQTTMAPM